MTRSPLPRALVALTLAAALTLGRPTFALGPFEKNHPAVEEGSRAYDEGHYDRALQRFDAAGKDVKSSAALDLDRGNALFKLGKYDEAKQAYAKAAESDRIDLREKAFYNLGNTFAANGQTKEAQASYRKALTLDPNDQQARHNLEMLLKKVPPPKQSGPDGGTPDAGQDAGNPDAGRDGGKPDAGQDGGQDGGQDAGTDGGSDGGQDGGSDGGQGDAGQDGGPGDGGQGDGGQPQSQNPDQGDGGSDAGTDGGTGEAEGEGEQPDGGSEAEMSKKDAEKLLDSMKQNERNLQLWKFQKKKPRKQDDKDW